ncbi:MULTISPECIES: hypothetical protein [unclassified Tenacibaculum]|uniref:hypothetical protein n=1 Tax=unclassified Tenacibaculum TaxID=2635139 RepID=UPI001F1CA324|nr:MULTISPECIES: hypothetical protein [unclassified Tenacibaculum]MCF2874085.1 hypothetical protein [Tenacibaculum sp. Cn5-1]MCF2934666.1 hypothetical protein [Tenacibaculum sp. Cn5-34]MCG7510876.1 hypothetical protein [Tenacibaculum sp. Cn5-46]
MTIPWDYVVFISIIIGFIIIVLFFNKKQNDTDIDFHLYENDSDDDFFNFD